MYLLTTHVFLFTYLVRTAIISPFKFYFTYMYVPNFKHKNVIYLLILWCVCKMQINVILILSYLKALHLKNIPTLAPPFYLCHPRHSYAAAWTRTGPHAARRLFTLYLYLNYVYACSNRKLFMLFLARFHNIVKYIFYRNETDITRKLE